ncbi:hypothetical protein KXD40_005003 [Peronospora effusa]|uniref:Uncharacterized protein n=1 Tax=Peronospora effusa TaxID=542832 RepID=A0A3M6VAB8_9STRA|nr:hypothetical protein DD238_003863 [Peronospora effusa]RQM10981.1 hypothetical protein DD237_004250 [Peronospora effusa]UIZ22156.1 hypothetical protein KXD40_005003 [Peronospora effusa]CAI5707984.1 unnamed protein product [Peronospora effusa]
MSYFNKTLWFTVYFVAGIGVFIHLVGDAYYKTFDMCEMYPQLSFHEKLLDEILVHSTRLPLVRLYVPTLYLLGTYLIVYAAKYWGLLNRGWPLLVDLLSGFCMLRSLPFGISEPDVPELLSENEDRDGDDKDKYFDDIPLVPMDDEACHKALAKLVQLKMQYANRTILRPDDWLVFDPVQEKLVLQKHMTRVSGNHKICNERSNGNKVDFRCEQTSSGDSDNQALLYGGDAKCAKVMQTERDIDTEVQAKQPPEIATKMRKRP